MYNLLGTRKQGVILSRSNYKNKNQYVILMEAISEQQEQDIEKYAKYYGQIMYKRADGIVINAKDIILYGTIDLDNEEDINYIERFNLMHEDTSKNWIYTNLDFDTGELETINGKLIGISTYDPIEWFEYNYLLLGKPERIIIYKYYNRK